jgi:hypothetical protein
MKERLTAPAPAPPRYSGPRPVQWSRFYREYRKRRALAHELRKLGYVTMYGVYRAAGLMLLGLVFLAAAHAQDVKPWGSKWYWASVAATAGGSAFDAGTSVYLNKYASAGGLHETNPLLANAQGQFVPARGIAAKVIVLGATVGAERGILYLLRNRPAAARQVEKIASWTNVGIGLGYTGIAAHNLTLY